VGKEAGAKMIETNRDQSKLSHGYPFRMESATQPRLFEKPEEFEIESSD